MDAEEAEVAVEAVFGEIEETDGRLGLCGGGDWDFVAARKEKVVETSRPGRLFLRRERFEV